jgi:hypothetical protein
VREALAEWLTSIGMIPAGVSALVENAAKSLVNLVRAICSGGYQAPDEGLRNPRQK